MDALEQRFGGIVVESLGDLYHNRNEETTVDTMAEKTMRAIYDLNQFVNLSAEEEEEIRSLVAELVEELLDSAGSAASYDAFVDSVTHIVERHVFNFRQYMGTIRDHGLLHTVTDKAPIACAEYSPELQLHLLGIDVSTIEEPILDIGCGEHGQLVQHLRELGNKAFGVDRTVLDRPDLIKADWSQLPVANETWGTVISHMAFSNHFMHHHLRVDGQPEVYARIYMSILRSLKKGGSFYYTPGLPFIEELLPPEEYRVTRIQHEEQKEFYSTQIEKL